MHIIQILSGTSIHVASYGCHTVCVHGDYPPAGESRGGVVGTPPGAGAMITITCLPDALPDTIEVDITKLELGESLHIGDLKLPAGVTATHAAEVVVAHIGKPAALVAEEAAVVAPAPAAKPAAAK